MTLTQANDFLAESEALYAILADLDDGALIQTTAFKGWTIQDALIHLHFWNRGVDLSARDAPAFQRMVGGAMQALQSSGSLRAVENQQIPERGCDLREAWIAQVREMAPRWAATDPKLRLPWVGPSMSARSAMTARQMETWAHGMAVFDVLGLVRNDTDRIRNVVVLGVNTFAWAFQVHGLDIPPQMPRLMLTAPSGAVWSMGNRVPERFPGSPWTLQPW